jgi:RHS repeat-associated protein
MLSRLTSVTTPEAGKVTYSYAVSGNPCSGDPSAPCTRTDARSIITTYAYDALNRLTSKTYSDGTPTANYYYDQASVTIGSWSSPTLTNPKGRLTEATTTSSTAVVYSYDAMGRPLNYWQCTPYNCGSSSIWQVQDGYDLSGDLTSWAHPWPFTITNTVNAAQQITQIQNSWYDTTLHPQNIAQSISYTAFGAPSSLENGCVGTGCVNGVETYQYNNRLQPVEVELGNGTNPPTSLFGVGCWVYNYYPGNSNASSCTLPAQPTTKNDNGNVMGYFYQDTTWNPTWDHTASYTYDGVNRLLTAVSTPYGQGNSSVSYNLTFNDTTKGKGYDAYGNMTCVMESNTVGLCPQLTFNGNNQAVTLQGSNSNFAYDASGDMTSDVAYGNPARNYAWDAEGRLTTVTDNSGGQTSTTYLYNALGQRVEIKTTSWQVEQVFDPQGERIGYYSVASGNNEWILAYVPFRGRELARYTYTTYFDFTHPNALGSAWISNDASDNLVQDWLFYPWGQPLAQAGLPWDTHFAGNHVALQGPSLADFTMYDAPARFYAPSPGRWHSPDPAGGDITNPQSWNRYAYALNNPTSMIDVSGLIAGTFGGGEGCDPSDPDCPSACDPLEGGSCDPPMGSCGNYAYLIDPCLPPDPSASEPAPNVGTPAGAGSTQSANKGTSTCTVDNGMTTAVTVGQMATLGPGPFGATVGSVAIDPWALGLQPGGVTNSLLGPSKSQITFSFSPSPNLPQGFPTTHTLGGILGGPSYRMWGSNFSLFRFDIYGLPSDAAANAATGAVAVTVTYPSSLPVNCGGPILDSSPTPPSPSGPVPAFRRRLIW